MYNSAPSMNTLQGVFTSMLSFFKNLAIVQNCTSSLGDGIFVNPPQGDVTSLWVSRVLKYPKSVWRLWQHFSCQLDEGLPKTWKKLNSHSGFLSYLQKSTANSAHLAAHFRPALVCPQKATMRIQFLPYFWNPLIK